MKAINRLSIELKKGYIQSFSIGDKGSDSAEPIITYRYNRMSLRFERIEQNRIVGNYKRLSDALKDHNALKEVQMKAKPIASTSLSEDDQIVSEAAQWFLQRFEAPINNLRNLIQSMYHFKLYNYGNR